MKLLGLLVSKELRTQLFGSKKNVPKDIAGTIITIFTGLILLVLVIFLFVMLERRFETLGLTYEILALFISVSALFQIIMNSGAYGEVIFGTEDVKVILSLPIPSGILLISKLAALWIKELINCCFFILPLFIAYGIMSGAGIGFYFGIAVLTLFFSVFISAVSACISPLMIKIKRYFSEKTLLLFIFSIIFIAVLFLLYGKVLAVLSDLISGNSMRFLFNSANAAIIEKITLFLVPSRQFASIATSGGRFADYIVIVLLIAVLAGLAYLICNKCYLSFIRAEHGKSSKMTAEKENAKRGVFASLLNKEMKEVFRSGDYLFSYISVALSLPLLCFVSLGVLYETVEKFAGAEYTAPFGIMIFVLYSSVTNTFAGDVISREGNKKMIMKTIPVGYKTQINAKVVLAFSVAVLSLLVTVILLAVEQIISPIEAVLFFFIGAGTTLSSIFALISKDIDNPLCPDVTGAYGGAKNKNISGSIIGSLFLSLLLGCIAVALKFFVPNLMYLGVFLIVILLFCYQFFSLYYKLEKRFSRAL